MVGWGGTDERDGASVVSAITNGDTFNYSIELLEAKFPLRVHQYALNVPAASGGTAPRRLWLDPRIRDPFSDCDSERELWPLYRASMGSGRRF